MNKHKHYLDKQVIIYVITDAHLQVQRRNIMLIKLDFACDLAKYSVYMECIQTKNDVCCIFTHKPCPPFHFTRCV